MTQKAKNTENNQSLIIIIAVVALAIVAAAAFIFLQSSGTGGAELDYSNVHSERTDDGAFILGDPEARITIVAFEDFLCPHCQSYEPTIKEFIEKYVLTGRARFEFRMLTAVNPQLSPVAFQLAECSAETEPGRFWEAHDMLFQIASTSRFNESSPRQFAEEIGIEYNTLLDCLTTADQYENDARLANRYEAISGTPSVAWRLDDSELRFDVISRRPSIQELGALVEVWEQRQD